MFPAYLGGFCSVRHDLNLWKGIPSRKPEKLLTTHMVLCEFYATMLYALCELALHVRRDTNSHCYMVANHPHIDIII